jgi:hypothetical protein
MLRKATAATLVYFAAQSDAHDSDQTSLTMSLNKQIKKGNGLFKGGKGVLVRTPDFFSSDPPVIVPATYWTNDINAPSAAYPSGNPWCPHGSSDGFEDLSWSKCDHRDGPWEYAVVSQVIDEEGMAKIYPHFDTIQDENWGWGVFYATDANSADKRCKFEKDGWNCPGYWVDQNGQASRDSRQKGAGYFEQGNPDANLPGGGAGCHFDTNAHAIDQVDAYNKQNDNLVQDGNCQCNYAFKSNWNDWVTNWIQHNKQKAGFEWRSWLGGSNKKAPTWAIDTTMCWVNNPKDMIAMQNAMYARRHDWNNGKAPSLDTHGDALARRYWGWNEVPVSAKLTSDPTNTCAYMIKLPANICSRHKPDAIDCLGKEQQSQLEEDLAALVNKGNIKLGKGEVKNRPGSYVVVVREYDAGGGNYQRQFFCQQWSSPARKFELVFDPISGTDSTGVCYLDGGSAASRSTNLIVNV